MKKGVFLSLLFLTVTVSAQRVDMDRIMDSLFRDSVGKKIPLPELTYLDTYRYVDSSKTGIISTGEQFYRLFSSHPKEKLPAIDFNRYYLLPRSVCVWCISVCLESYPDPCHRNACDYTRRWWLVEKSKKN